MLKKIIASFLLVCVLVVPLGACKNNKIKTSTSNVSSTSGNTTSKLDSSSKSSSVTSNSSSSKVSTSTSVSSSTSNTGIPINGNLKYSDFGIKSGTKGMEENLNLGGKKITMAIFDTARYQSAAFQRSIRAFEAKFNCTIETQTFAFGSVYTNQVLARIASNNPYDIIYLQYSWFYDMLAANMYESLNQYVTTADFSNTSNPTSSLDFAKTANVSWKSKIYGLCDYYSAQPMIIYYNKKNFVKAGLDDPRELYNQGKWTWDKFIEMGLEVTDNAAGVYFGGYNFFRKEIVMTNGTKVVEIENGIPKLKVSTSAYYNALKIVQKMGYGENQIIKPQDRTDPLNDFYNGVTYTYTEESDRYISITNKMPELAAFGKDKKNLGVVPLPLGNDNKTGAYPTGWLEAVCASKGCKDPRMAVAWAKFRSTYKDPVTDTNSLNVEDKKMVDKILSKISAVDYPYADSSKFLVELEWQLHTAVATGGDISQMIKQYEQPMQTCINTTLSRMNLIK